MKVLHVGWGFRPWRPGGLIAYAEDVMALQAASGHEVSYFCSGRHLPRIRRSLLHRWRRDGVAVFEVINGGVPFGSPRGDVGTRVPELDLSETGVERHFERVLAEVRPEVIHLQELAALPSSVIDLAAERGFPTVMTLQDYFPLCPTLKLYDADGNVCLRRRPGSDCRRCCREGVTDTSLHVRQTIDHELIRFGNRFPRARTLYRERVAPVVWRPFPDRPPAPPPAPEPPPPAEVYDRRRVVNVERLGRVDVLLAMSARLAEIYAELGVPAERLRTLHLTLAHIAALRPRRMGSPPALVRFAGLNVALLPQKGAGVVAEAVRRLDEAGFAGRYRLELHGGVAAEHREELEASPSVELRPHYDSRRLDELLESVDVGIVPSVWEEAYGYVGIEFLAKGIPVIGNAIGGIPDYTRPGETGWLNRSADGAGLAVAMAHVIEHPQEVLDLHRSILASRTDLVKPLDRHVAELEEVYREAVSARGDTSGGSGRSASGPPARSGAG